jgi:hypothetical protein
MWYYELARRLASAMNETYDALDRDRRDWWNELALRVSEMYDGGDVEGF